MNSCPPLFAKRAVPCFFRTFTHADSGWQRRQESQGENLPDLSIYRLSFASFRCRGALPQPCPGWPCLTSSEHVGISHLVSFFLHATTRKPLRLPTGSRFVCTKGFADARFLVRIFDLRYVDPASNKRLRPAVKMFFIKGIALPQRLCVAAKRNCRTFGCPPALHSGRIGVNVFPPLKSN